jgi:hypothetical protein
MTGEHHFKADAKTMRAFTVALGGLAFAIAQTMPTEQRKDFKQSLIRLCRSRNAVGDTIAGTLLLDMAGAVEAAEPDTKNPR